MVNRDFSTLRREYSRAALNEETLKASPFEQMSFWIDEALKANVTEPYAMTLATVSKDGQPSMRVVLLRKLTTDGLTFFTNYLSRKGREISTNDKAAVNFFWPDLERQVRVEGEIVKTTSKESAEYFSTRPVDSQLTALASEQSTPIPDRKFIEEKYLKLKNQYQTDSPKCPDHWGGYRLVPHYFEFWQGRENRLHDRLAFIKKGDQWKVARLSP